MAEYASRFPGTVDDEANIAILRADLHLLFGQRRFTVVPKPSAALSSSGPPSSYALAIHVLNDDEETGEFPGLYQNISLQTKHVDKLSREFLFAQFAWALFPLLWSFLETPVPRRLAVIIKQDENRDRPNRISSYLSHPQFQWMNNAQFTQHLHMRGESRNGSRKRRPSQMTRDAEADVEDVAYEERWERRSDSLSADNDAGYLDHAQEQLDEATRWYEYHGRYAAVDLTPDDWKYEGDANRGRSRYRDHRSNHAHDANADSNADLEGVPNLLWSPISGSNRSSVRLHSPTEAESRAGLETSDRGDPNAAVTLLPREDTSTDSSTKLLSLQREKVLSP